MNKIKIKVGDVFEIPLPDGRFAYGRIYKDASVGIYRQVTSKSGNPPIGSRDFLFIVGITDRDIKTGKLKIVGHDPFANNESSWPPPYSIINTYDGTYSIYHLGEIRKASKEECVGLEEAAVWDIKYHVIPRIMKELSEKT